jgi:hypothetical protein
MGKLNNNSWRCAVLEGVLGVGGLVGGIITLLLGIVILIKPRLIAAIIGIWLIIVGIIAIIGSL